MSHVFDVEWLEDVRLRPILKSIYDFLEKEKTTPSISTLHQLLKDKDDTLYLNRYKYVLDELDKVQYTISDVIYNLERARTVALSRSFKDRMTGEYVRELLEEDKGDELLKEFEDWRSSFHESNDEVECSFKQAVDSLLRSEEFVRTHVPIPTGIEVLDEFSGGGVKPKNLAVLIAPTGHGKSVALLNIAYNIATMEKRNVLYVTNELTMEETTERFLSRLLQIPNHQLINDHSLITEKSHDVRLEKHWVEGFDQRLRLVEKIGEFSTDFIESLAIKYMTLYGWRPDVVVIDYMERMRPTIKGLKRGETWLWLGHIARDLVRIGKKNNWLVWTACQTNRSGMAAKTEQSMDQAQGSIYHLQEAALVVMMRQRKASGVGTVLEFKAEKARHYGKGERTYYEVDLSRMTIKNQKVEIDPTQFLDIQKVDKAAKEAFGGEKKK